MKLYITSPARAASFLSQQGVAPMHRTNSTEIGYGLSLIYDREWDGIIVTIDVKEKFSSMMKKRGTEFSLNAQFQVFAEDDLPELDAHDQIIVINDDNTIVTASRELKQAA